LEKLNFIDYFQKLFSTARHVGVDECLAGVVPRVTNEMNIMLTGAFSLEEVDVALS
jgi:hypothetical protein